MHALNQEGSTFGEGGDITLQKDHKSNCCDYGVDSLRADGGTSFWGFGFMRLVETTSMNLDDHRYICHNIYQTNLDHVHQILYITRLLIQIFYEH
jgi:hypothetical protein